MRRPRRVNLPGGWASRPVITGPPRRTLGCVRAALAIAGRSGAGVSRQGAASWPLAARFLYVGGRRQHLDQDTPTVGDGRGGHPRGPPRLRLPGSRGLPRPAAGPLDQAGREMSPITTTRPTDARVKLRVRGRRPSDARAVRIGKGTKSRRGRGVRARHAGPRPSPGLGGDVLARAHPRDSGAAARRQAWRR